jgi:hypothetical protein
MQKCIARSYRVIVSVVILVAIKNQFCDLAQQMPMPVQHPAYMGLF